MLERKTDNMKKMFRKLTLLLLTLALLLTVAACGGKETDPGSTSDPGSNPASGDEPNPGNEPNPGDEPGPGDEPSPGNEPDPGSEPDPGQETDPVQESDPVQEPDLGKLNVAFLKGPTGIGASYFMERNANGDYGERYNITVETDPVNVNSALISKNLDIAAVPTNVAAMLYNKTNGDVQIVAVNTLGVLYILEKGDTVQEVYDLTGKTVYATGQGSNPQYVLEYILSESGLVIGETVEVEYLPSDELATRMAAGELDVCMLPVPNATSVLMKNEDVREALDLSAEWATVTGGTSILTQGCIVARKSVSDADLAAFLEEYKASVEYMMSSENLDDAAALAVKHGIVPSEPVAKRALPDCNLTYLAGSDAMREALTGYYSVLWSAAPESVGGSVPDDGFYREVPEGTA